MSGCFLQKRHLLYDLFTIRPIFSPKNIFKNNQLDSELSKKSGIKNNYIFKWLLDSQPKSQYTKSTGHYSGKHFYVSGVENKPE